VPAEALHELEFVGELSLTGEIRPIRGALAMVLALRSERVRRRLVVPGACRDEAALVSDGVSLAAADLVEVCAHLRGESPLERIAYSVPPDDAGNAPPDFADVKGQWSARRALEIAAAGAHSVLMVGPPGAGKSMLAARFPGLLPPMDEGESLQCALVQSIAGRFEPSRWGRRPFRSPHHTASGVALVGGGGVPRPGEITLAHLGVLFLDELPEFNRSVLEVLREPLETGEITISRAGRQATFPARFQLVAAMNPCPCGYLGHRSGRCRCGPELVARYRGRISGPLLDRIDLQLDVPAASPDDLARPGPAEPTASIRERVLRAWRAALDRQRKPNAMLAPREVDAHCVPEPAAAALLRRAMAASMLSARGFHRVLKLARTIADLDGAATVRVVHAAEALQYRRFELAAGAAGAAASTAPPGARFAPASARG
jgi:magnesium chelatase family protein